MEKLDKRDDSMHIGGSITDELRAMLDERGVEWTEGIARPELTQVRVDGKVVKFHPWQPNTLKVSLFNITPEEAIDATLGSSNCTNDCTNGERTGTCIADETETISVRGDTWGNYYFDKHFTIHVMECSECGHTYEHVNGDYEFCPHCGRRVVEVNA